MSKKANDDDFVPVFIVGLYKDNPAVKTLDYGEGLSSIQIAGFMTAILDCVVDLVDECNQTEFEEEILEAFKTFISDRFGHTNKYKLEDDE